MVPNGGQAEPRPAGTPGAKRGAGGLNGAAGHAPPNTGTNPCSEELPEQQTREGGDRTRWLVGGRPASGDRRESAAGVRSRAPEGFAQEKKERRQKCGVR